MRRLIDIIALIILIFVGYHFRDELRRGALLAGTELGIIAPCSRPITYSLGTFDERFGLSRETFLKELRDAATLWETVADRDLFAYAENGDLTINLIYDYRQQSTQQLDSLGSTIDYNKNAYEKLRIQYVALKTKISTGKIELSSLISDFEINKREYERQAEQWNRSNKTSKGEYESLQSTKEELDQQLARIESKQIKINADIDVLNSIVGKLNTFAKELNIKVEEYNTIGATTGEAFDEGEYISDVKGQRINIYQYSNGIKLDRVLAHELGHALNLQHVDDSGAVMYYLNSGTSRNLSDGDVAELVRVCKL